MWIRACTLVLVWLLAASPLSAQEAVPASLSLQQALEISRTTNPSFLQTRNDEALADWNVRQAWGALLPSANASTGVSWQGAGEQLFGSLTAQDLGFGNQPSFYLSNYGISVKRDFIKRECKRADEEPSYENTFKRLHLNMRTSQDVKWIDVAKWDACLRDLWIRS